MYNDPRAKDLLAQYPRQLAEGGAVDQPFQAPAVAPRGAPLPTLPSANAAQSFQAPVVAPRQRPVLAPVENAPLSMSQQFARERAAQDAMVRDAIRSTGLTNPSTMDYRQLQRAVRAGDITGENIKQKFVDQELEARVRNAYAAIGRTGGVVPTLEMPKQGGATADTYKQVRQDEFNYFADQLKQGKISPADFQNAFLTKASIAPTTDLEAQRVYVNSARKALGLPDLEVPKPRVTNFYGFGQNMGGTKAQYGGMGSIAGPKLKPKEPKLPTQPIDLSGTAGAPVQLFNAGGEAVADQGPRSMDLEQFLLENSRMQAGPVDVQEVRSSRGPGKYDTRISKDEGGFQAFADVDVGDKKLSQLGASFVGRGRIGNYEVQYVFDPDTKQPMITGAIRKELSPTSDVSAEGVYVPQKDGKDYYNAGVRYTKRFEDGGEVTNENVRTLRSIDVTPEDKPITSYAKDALNYVKSNVVDPAADMAYEGWKMAVPPHIRFVSQALLGDRTKPFTEKDLTEEELAGYADIIAKSEQRKAKDLPSFIAENQKTVKQLDSRLKEFFVNNKLPKDDSQWSDGDWDVYNAYEDLKKQRDDNQERIRGAKRDLAGLPKGTGNIQYFDYEKAGEATGNMDDPVNLGNTIGRFNYKKDKTGKAVITDRYDFINEKDLPMVEKYEKLRPLSKYWQVLQDSIGTGDIGYLPAYAAFAYMGRDGRDVNITVPKSKTIAKKTKK